MPTVEPPRSSQPDPSWNGRSGPERNRRLREVAAVFLRLGSTTFGGPAVHVAMMEEEMVRRRGWVTHAEFLDLWGATNLIPGPNSTEMALLLGHRRAGWAGLLVAGLCFILPATLIVIGVGWAYVRFGKLPAAQGLLYGVKPVIIAVVGQAVWKLGRTALRTRWLAGIGLIATALSFAGISELPVLLAAGLVALLRVLGRPGGGGIQGRVPVIGLSPWGTALSAPVAGATGAGVAVAGMAPFSTAALFGVFLKIGSVLYGSGYVLLAFLRTDLVEHRHWLTENQLLDAVAVGQFTPGPVFTTATFIGYVLGGVPAAAAATVGIFLPAFVLVAASGTLIPKLRSWPATGALLDGVNAASMGLMAVVTVRLAVGAIMDVPTVLLALVSALLLFRWKVNSAWLVLGGGLIGLALGTA